MDLNAILPSCISLIGTIFSVLLGSKLITYRIEQLEKKVEKHNSVIERTFVLEQKVSDIKDDIATIFKKI